MEVNGKEYPLWSQFVEQKSDWVGGVLEDLDMGLSLKTTICDIKLEPNGKDSAFFSVVGDDFTCGFDVRHGGLKGTSGGGGIDFFGYGGHHWRVKKKRHTKN